MLSDTARRRAIAVLSVGALLLVLGIFLVVASQPIVVEDFAFVPEVGDEVYFDANGMISSRPQYLNPATGGVLLGAGVALAAGVGGFVLGRRR
ncbi:hypothetical protein [uncultured Arthrobacter sp.]|uniref:hypothetical protein n=1 Tax=uncultured Arthrobacter sp. TaxID=114050 RepID=UPI002628FE93|nr:hypothetical protein [uncultured Arthrobacter sp.]